MRLADVVNHYNHGGARYVAGVLQRDPRIDPDIRPLNLSYDEFWDLVWFVDSATRGTFPYQPDPAGMMAGGR